MRLEELILDGFKSYCTRTTISGWDASFNAISGLNGSGKSNILDAICFVLGITNLTAVRAANMQDLIYKRGQAGITRASVTAVFNNTDKSNSPIGMDHLDKISVTRQISMNKATKYLVNGQNKTQEFVQNLFQSVGLNINNPNFLIMQGKITKVLNMKPAEILGMIEEAAGTKMYEVKKESAMKKMQKKDKKLTEISSLLEEEIKPKLDQYREDKRRYLEFQKGASELERLSRLVVAFDYVNAIAKSQESTTLKATKQAAIKEGTKQVKQYNTEIAAMKKEYAALVKRKEKEMAQGGKIAQLEAKSKELAKALAAMKTKLQYKGKDVEAAHAAVKAADINVKEIEKQKEDKILGSAKLQADFKTLKDEYDAATAELEQAESLLQSLVTGLSRSDNAAQDSGYMGQLATAKAKLSEIHSSTEQAKIKIAHLTKELKEKEPRAKKAVNEGGDLTSELAAAKQEVLQLEEKVSAFAKLSDKDDALEKQYNDLSRQVQQLKAQHEALRSGLSRLDFNYTTPSRDFDRRKVKGPVVNLISLSDENVNKSTALEVCAGGRLYNVVVDDDATGSELLNRGQLTQRVTLIPLNKISPYTVSNEKLAVARKVSNGKADVALNLIDYSPEVKSAMSYVFGSTLICPDPNTAKSVCFNPGVKLKTVTLEGDVYNPSGSLEGGAAPSNAEVLVRVKRLQDIEKNLKGAQAKLEAVEKQWSDFQTRQSQKAQLQTQLDLKKHEVVELEARMADSNASRIIAEVESLRKQLEEQKEIVSNSKTVVKEAEAECKRIQKEMDEFANNRDSKLKELKAKIAKMKTGVSKQNLQVKTMKGEVQTADLETKQMDVDIESAKQEAQEARDQVERSKQELQNLQTEHENLTMEHEEIELAYKEETKQLSAFDDELAAIDQAVEDKQNAITSLGEEEMQLVNDIEKLVKEEEKCASTLKQLLSAYAWIDDEKASFGVAGSQYNFENARMAEIKKQCAELQAKQKSQKKKVNPKVMNLIDNLEKKQAELIKMHDQVRKDRSKIEETINKLDDYKRDALIKTWEVVNKNFGVVFGDLLPGNFCKLEPPESMDIIDGLEVKVRLGSVWKQSLTELSGGQRSLIALSLILSLLQTKPAPMYILDEVDAALDLSHTQHIGQLFRSRFKGSQFIVISLKEGLFQNANVLFRTRFVDGTSTVQVQKRGSS